MRYLPFISSHVSRNFKSIPQKFRNTTTANTNTLCLTRVLSRDYCTPSQPPSEKVAAIVDEISGLTLLEVADLTEVLRQKMELKEMPSMFVMMPGMGFSMKGAAKGGAAPGKAEEKAEKTVFDLKLDGFDPATKIKVIKEVRGFTDLGLKEAKDLVEKAPTLLKKGVAKEEAEKIIAKMKEVGAKVSME
ncbi:50S ribosomal protein L7/L12-like [Melia azedarach]|uniref:50S ribosomal protein L7/L12-like n=1 Tax=Melia azedarach TaxID=155640 RepID=A0ACC1XU88_MELAZ|nr:50S ribosomal protein L7/L12-like [Melia azedarach]